MVIVLGALGTGIGIGIDVILNDGSSSSRLTTPTFVFSRSFQPSSVILRRFCGEFRFLSGSDFDMRGGDGGDGGEWEWECECENN